MTVNDPRSIRLYHFTHVDHIASMLTSGVVCDSDAQAGQLIQAEVGDRTVKNLRRTRRVDVGPGGVVADYVPFYFAPRSPMLYVIWMGGVPEYTEGEDPLVYLVTDIESVLSRGLAFAFSDGNSTNLITECFNDLAHLDRVDWTIMEETYWRDTFEDGDRMRRRMAEFLVHRELPWDAVLEIAVKNEEMASQVQALLDAAESNVPVVVRRQWYYG